MPATRRAASRVLNLLAIGLLLPPAVSVAARAQPSPAPVRLFRVVTMRGDVTLGFTPAELAALGEGPEAERIARRIAREGQVTAWRYAVTRAPDGSTMFATREKVAVLRQDSLTVEPYTPNLPVAAPPAQ
jgi:hypothetical protein